MTPKRNISPFIKRSWELFAVFILFILIFSVYVYSEKQIDRANDLRVKSFLLANELRQSSDDLTRMIRTYAATGNPIYKAHYQEILDIRNGKQARPLHYDYLYWNLVRINDQRPQPKSNTTIPLLEMMKQAGFTQSEFEKLAQAKKNSDLLTKTEFDAMNLVEQKASPTQMQINREKALTLLYDENYHQAKMSIMQPIQEFYMMMHERTYYAVFKAQEIAYYLRIAFIFIGVLLFFMLWRLYRTLNFIIGTDIDTLYTHIAYIAKGNFSLPIKAKSQDSILGWLEKTQFQLKDIMARNQRLTQLYSALSQCNQAIVRSKNEAELFEIICRDAINFGKMKMANIGMIDEQSQELRFVAYYGDGTDYLHDLHIVLDPKSPLSQGPTGRAFLQNQAIWCQDFQNNPSTAPWHEKAAKYGWKASMALPLHRHGKTVGVFTIYANEINAFDEAARRLLQEMNMDIDYALESFERDIARERAEADLAQSNNLLKSIIDTAPIRIFWKDKDLNYLGCNLVFAQDAGETSEADVIGKNDFQLCWSEQAALYQADDRKVMQSHTSKLFYEEPQTTPDGELIWLSTSKIPLFNKNQEVIGILGIYEDTTLRKRMELSLEKEKNTAQNYLDIVGVMILVLDVNNNVVLINRRGCEIIGYDAQEVIGKNWMENFVPQHIYKQVFDVSNALKDPSKSNIFYFENPILTKNGQERMIAWNNTHLFDEQKNIIGLLTSGEDITDRLAAQEQSLYLAKYDSLTGLPNRAYLDEQINYALILAKRREEKLAVIFLDLDHFKNINDTLGHNIGDKLLIEVSKRLKANLREEDIIARLGGDEFIIVLPNLQTSGVETVAQKLLEIMLQPFNVESHELNPTLSLGIALYPDDGENFEVLYKNADTAMYRAKQDGRNGYSFFTEEMQKNSIRNLELSNAMRHALKENQFELYYQPQLSASSGELIGAEALIRWRHPQFGFISPAEFIPIAEENGLILQIGEWVLKTAATQTKAWLDQGAQPMIMAVNLSAVQFRHPKLLETISAIIENTGLAPEYLELELTEGVAMHDPKKAISIMNDLHNRGVRLSIDDFGTGYSSLSYLKKFKIYKLKIDQSFIRDINIDDEDKAIVSAIIQMAKSLGLKTIAEGVETTSQLEYLKEQGCDEIQGYFYSKPVPAKEFELFRESLHVRLK